MLKIATLAACVLGFLFLAPMAWAEFRRALPRSRTRMKDTAETKQAEEKPKPAAAA